VYNPDMKKLIIILVLGLLVTSGTQANATTTKDLKGQAKEVLTGVLRDRQEVRKEKVGRLAANLTNKLTNSLSNIEGLLTRVKDRLAKMEAAGKDVSAAKAKVPAAESAIAIAKTSVGNLMTGLRDLAQASTTPKTIRESSNAAVRQTIQEIKKAHQAVVDVIRSVKPGQVKPVTATTTATSTN
jgi:chromosome segregation ATPase